MNSQCSNCLSSTFDPLIEYRRGKPYQYGCSFCQGLPPSGRHTFQRDDKLMVSQISGIVDGRDRDTSGAIGQP